MSFTPELGHLAFGSKWERYSIPIDEDLVAGALRELAKALGAESEGIYGINFDNEVFSMSQYYCGECKCEDDQEDHSPTCPVVLPNFHHNASGLAVHWYKYLLRDGSCNMPNLTIGHFLGIILDCLDSIQKKT